MVPSSVPFSLPCFPLRSPFWQYAGNAGSHTSESVTLNVSRCESALEQLPSEAIKCVCMWLRGREVGVRTGSKRDRKDR